MSDEVSDNEQANIALTLDDKVDQRVAHTLIRLFSPVGHEELNIRSYNAAQSDPQLQRTVLVGVMQLAIADPRNNILLDLDIRKISGEEIASRLVKATY